MKHKIKEWVQRYLPAEILALILSLSLAGLVYFLTQNKILAAYGATIGDNTGYYGFISIREVILNRIHHKRNKRKYGFKSFLKTLRNLIVEFGPSESLDFFIIRPFIIYIATILISNFGIAIFTGKIIADITFYIPTIIAYELRKKHLRD